MKNAPKKYNDTKTEQAEVKSMHKESLDTGIFPASGTQYGQNNQNITVKTHKEEKKTKKR